VIISCICYNSGECRTLRDSKERACPWLRCAFLWDCSSDVGCALRSYNDECALDRELDGRFANTHSSYAFRRRTFAEKGAPRYAMKIINR